MPLLLAVGLFLVLVPRVQADSATATVTSTDGVNLRAGPGTTFPVLVVIPYGASVSVTGPATADNWLPVLYNGLAGFAMGDYLTLSAGPPPAAPTPVPAAPPAAPAPLPAPAPTPASTPSADAAATVIPPDGLNLRAGPATTYPVVVTVPGGARVQVVGKATADGWYSVVYRGKLGWVDGKYLSLATAGSITAPAATGRFIWPVESRHISTVFSSAHPGIDIDEFPNGGNPVVAAAAGTVTFAGGSICCSYGLYVIVRHADGYTTLYAHLSNIAVSEGQDVAQGALLGKTGNTGFSTGAHLHFEVRKDGVAVNPLTLLAGSFAIE